jgi:hypothetical protein
MILSVTPGLAGIEAVRNLEFLDAAVAGESRIRLLNPAG